MGKRVRVAIAGAAALCLVAVGHGTTRVEAKASTHAWAGRVAAMSSPRPSSRALSVAQHRW